MPARRFTPPWIFALGMVPMGTTGGHVIALSYLLEAKYHLGVGAIGALSALTFVPHTWKFLWTPALDTWIRRRSWYLIASTLAWAATLVAFLVPPTGHIALLSFVLLLANIGAATSNSALGALLAATVHPDHKGVASGCFSAGSLLSTGLLGGLIILLAAPPPFLLRNIPGPVPMPAIGAVVALIMAACSLSVLLIDEAPPERRPLLPLLKAVLLDTWGTVRSRTGWTGLLICLSPVGTAALTNLFGAIATDYRASSLDVMLATGLLAGLANALGSVLGGWLADRINRRAAYCLSGALTAACALLMALAPATRGNYLAYTLGYNLVAGLAYASFYAFVFEMIEATDGATTKFGLFIGTSNLAISYVTYLDGLMYRHGARLHLGGRAGVLVTDAVLNIGGILAVAAMMTALRRRQVATRAAGA